MSLGVWADSLAPTLTFEIPQVLVATLSCCAVDACWSLPDFFFVARAITGSLPRAHCAAHSLKVLNRSDYHPDPGSSLPVQVTALVHRSYTQLLLLFTAWSDQRLRSRESSLGSEAGLHFYGDSTLLTAATNCYACAVRRPSQTQ